MSEDPDLEAPDLEAAALPFLWKDALTEKLIEMFKENACLYDTKNPDYHNKDLKKAIVLKIADEIGTNSERITKKIKSLRSQFTREKQREKQKERRSRDGTNAAYVSKWMHYERLLFLEGFVVPRQSSTSLKSTEIEAADMGAGHFVPTETSPLQSIQVQASQLQARQLQASQLQQARQLQANQLQAQLQARQLEVRQLEARQLEARQLEARQLEARQLHARQLQASQLRASQLRASQLEDTAIQVATQVDFTPPSHTLTTSSRKRRRSDSAEDNELVKKAFLYMSKATERQNAQKNETDRYAIFGQYVACELKEIGDPDMERWARQQITTILCQAQSGNLPASNSNQNNDVLQSHSYACGPFFRSAPSCLELSDSSQPPSPQQQ